MFFLKLMLYASMNSSDKLFIFDIISNPAIHIILRTILIIDLMKITTILQGT